MTARLKKEDFAAFQQWKKSGDKTPVPLADLMRICGVKNVQPWTNALVYNPMYRRGDDYTCSEVTGRSVYHVSMDTAIKFFIKSRGAKALTETLLRVFFGLWPTTSLNNEGTTSSTQDCALLLTDADFDEEETGEGGLVCYDTLMRKKALEFAVADRLAQRLNGKRHVRVESGIVDIVTKEYAIEVKNIVCWKHAIGQVACYAVDLTLKPVIHLFYIDDRTLARLRDVINRKCAMFFVSVWYEYIGREQTT